MSPFSVISLASITGAMLDVFRQEPLPADNLGRFLDGQPLKEIVDRNAGY